MVVILTNLSHNSRVSLRRVVHPTGTFRLASVVTLFMLRGVDVTTVHLTVRVHRDVLLYQSWVGGWLVLPCVCTVEHIRGQWASLTTDSCRLIENRRSILYQLRSVQHLCLGVEIVKSVEENWMELATVTMQMRNDFLFWYFPNSPTAFRISSNSILV